MKKCVFISLLLLLGSGLAPLSQSAVTHDPALQWYTLYTKNFAIHYHTGIEAIAQRVATISEETHARLTRQINWEPDSRTQIVLSDRYDLSNGYATIFPRKEMTIIVSSPDGTSVLGDHDNWLELLINHEYTHILHFDKAKGLPRTLRDSLGRPIFLFPNLLQPPWLTEGLATYEETDVMRGIGRGQNSVFRMMMRLETQHGVKPLEQINQPLTTWPMNTSRYLYGVYFYQFIAERYGGQKLAELIDEYSDNLLPFALNSNAEIVLGKDLYALWDEFTVYLNEEFLPEIEQIKKSGEQSGKRITHTGYQTGMPLVGKDGSLYYLRQDMERRPALMHVGKDNALASVVGRSSGKQFDIHWQSGIILTESDWVKSTNWFSDIHHIDLNTGKQTQLTHGGRYLYATWSPDGKNIIAVHNENGNHALHLLTANGIKIATLWEGNDGTVLGAPDWSPDGKELVLSVWRPSTYWNLETFTLETMQWRPLTKGPSIEATPRYSQSGKNILFSADYSGIFNIYSLNLENLSMKRLSHVVGGAFSPTWNEDESSIYYVGANPEGFDIYHLADIQPQEIRDEFYLADAQAWPPTSTATNVLNEPWQFEHIENYTAKNRLASNFWLPYWQIDDTHNELGFTLWGRDPLNRHNYNMTFASDVRHNFYLGSMNYVYDRLNPTLKFSLGREAISYLDAEGDLERFRKSDYFSAEALWPYISHENRWLIHAGLHHANETDLQIISDNGATEPLQDGLLGLAVNFSSAQRYPRSISPSDGRNIKLIIESSDVLESDYGGNVYTMDWREFIHLPNQNVLAIRGVTGISKEDARPFRLGGNFEPYNLSPDGQLLASTLVSAQSIFGKRAYQLRGYAEGLPELTGSRMRLFEMEWRFPIRLIERGLMTPPVGVHQLHGKVFYNFGEAWDRTEAASNYKRGYGTEITAELILGYQLNIDVRIGYARGIDSLGENQAYLELGTSF